MEAYGHTLAVAHVGLGSFRSIRKVSNIIVPFPEHGTALSGRVKRICLNSFIIAYLQGSRNYV